MLDRIRELLQWDRTLMYAIAARLWQAVSGPVTLFLIFLNLDQHQQGLYYGIVYLAGLQTLFELGLINVLITQAGHQFGVLRRAGIRFFEETSRAAADIDTATSDARWTVDDEIRRATSGIGQLMKAADAWFLFVAILFTLTALLVGHRMLGRIDTTNDWQLPLFVAIACSAISVGFSSRLAILEGAGGRELIYRWRWIQGLLGSLGVWFVLMLGGKLWSIAIASAIQMMLTVWLIMIDQAPFFRLLRRDKSREVDFSWMRDILPLQWRIALIGVAHFAATQMFVLILLVFRHDVAAGKLGATLSMTGAIQAIALAWVHTKLALVSSYHGAGNREQAGNLWRRTAILSTSFLIAALTILALILVGLERCVFGQESRFIDVYQLFWLSIGIVANHLVSLQAYYVLSRRSLPMFRAAMIGSLFTAVAVWVGGYAAGLDGVIGSYLVAVLFVTLPLHTLAYLQYRSKT